MLKWLLNLKDTLKLIDTMSSLLTHHGHAINQNLKMMNDLFVLLSARIDDLNKRIAKLEIATTMLGLEQENLAKLKTKKKNVKSVLQNKK